MAAAARRTTVPNSPAAAAEPNRELTPPGSRASNPRNRGSVHGPNTVVARSRSTYLEFAVGRVFGVERARTADELLPALAPLEALEAAVRQALERPPCVVSFSGGRDSSCVLAIAVRAARKEGLELPIPVTLRFSDAPRTDETSWQELVVRSLGLGEWEILEPENLDLIGPVSAPILRDHGVLWPPNAFFHAPALVAASGGSLLTGFGGDQLLGGWRRRSVADALARRRRLEPYDVLRLPHAALPRSVRAPLERRRQRAATPSWIRPDAGRRLVTLATRDALSEPVWWPDWIRWRASGRDLCTARSSFAALAHDRGALAVSPLTDRRFVSAVANAGGRLGFGSRTDAMLAIFDGLLPEALLRRESKATFDEVFWRDGSRGFAEHWDGANVDTDIVDPEALQREWLKPSPHARSAPLLQSAWLAQATS